MLNDQDFWVIALSLFGIAATVALGTIAVFHAGRRQDDDYGDWLDHADDRDMAGYMDWADRRGDGE